MSNRYSTSPALQLKVGDSKLRVALHGALCLILIYILCSLYLRGYALLIFPVATVGVIVLWWVGRNSMRGVELRWRQGCWTLERDGIITEISLSRSSRALPWLIYIAFTDVAAGSIGHLWLYSDCAPQYQLRRLRVRLTLQG